MIIECQQIVKGIYRRIFENSNSKFRVGNIWCTYIYICSICSTHHDHNNIILYFKNFLVCSVVPSSKTDCGRIFTKRGSHVAMRINDWVFFFTILLLNMSHGYGKHEHRYQYQRRLLELDALLNTSVVNLPPFFREHMKKDMQINIG